MSQRDLDVAVAEAEDALADSLLEATVAYLRAKITGDTTAADALIEGLSADVLLAGVTAAFMSSIEASGYPPEVFLQQLLDSTPGKQARRSGLRAFSRRL